MARAGVGTALNSPHQWGRGPDGFAKRVGSSMGKHVVKETIQTIYNKTILEPMKLPVFRLPETPARTFGVKKWTPLSGKCHKGNQAAPDEEWIPVA